MGGFNVFLNAMKVEKHEFSSDKLAQEYELIIGRYFPALDEMLEMVENERQLDVGVSARSYQLMSLSTEVLGFRLTYHKTVTELARAASRAAQTRKMNRIEQRAYVKAASQPVRKKVKKTLMIEN